MGAGLTGSWRDCVSKVGCLFWAFKDFIGDALEHVAEVSTERMQFALLLHFGRLESPLNNSFAIDFGGLWLLGHFLTGHVAKQLLQRGNIVLHLFQIALFVCIGLFRNYWLSNQRNWTDRFNSLWSIFGHVLLVFLENSLHQSVLILRVCRFLFKIWLTKLFLYFFKVLLMFHEVL